MAANDNRVSGRDKVRGGEPGRPRAHKDGRAHLDIGAGARGIMPFQVRVADAAYLAGETSVGAFRSRVGFVYPKPTARIAGKDYWLTRKLLDAIEAVHGSAETDAADLL